MRFFNIIITLCVGLIMAGGAALTYKQRLAEQRMEMELRPVAAVVAPAAHVKRESIRASLPKWDDKNYKGLVYRP
jgi:hypothetical protein